MPNISVIGSGTFGTVISSTLSRNKHNNVKLWCRRDEVAQEILNCSTHSTYFPSSTSSSFLKNVRATSDLKVALRKADIVVIAVPSQYLSGILSRLFIPENAVIVSLVKSLHYDPEKAKLELTSDTIERFFKKNEVVVLHGGNIYTEMIDDNGFAEATIGHRNTRSGLLAARKVKRSFDALTQKHSFSDDRTGVELAGGLKNVLSLAAGFSKGLNLGSNTVAAIIRNGLREMSRFARDVLNLSNCRTETFSLEASGVGDTILTLTSGRGQRLASAFIQSLPKPNSVVESELRWSRLENEMFPGMKLPDYQNAKVCHALLKGQENVCPIINAVYEIAFECAQDPRQVLITALRKSIDFKSNISSNGIRNKRAVVTGAAGTIGSSIVTMLCNQGARVVALDRDEKALKRLRLDTGCETLVVDLSNWNMLGKKLESLNTIDPSDECISLVVNCAGVAVFEKIFDTSERAFDLQYNINVKALCRVTNVLAKEMVRRGVKGSIVNISSQSSTLSLKDHLIYSSTKASVDHVTRITAFELGEFGIRVNSVRPTVVMSELVRKNWDKDLLKVMKSEIPLKRLAMPHDVASAVVFLLSDKASMITGTDLCVDGGRASCRL